MGTEIDIFITNHRLVTTYWINGKSSQAQGREEPRKVLGQLCHHTHYWNTSVSLNILWNVTTLFISLDSLTDSYPSGLWLLDTTLDLRRPPIEVTMCLAEPYVSIERIGIWWWRPIMLCSLYQFPYPALGGDHGQYLTYWTDTLLYHPCQPHPQPQPRKKNKNLI